VDRPAAAPLLSPISFLLRFDQLAKATLVDPPDTLAQDGPNPFRLSSSWPQPMPFRPRRACCRALVLPIALPFSAMWQAHSAK